MLLCFSCSLHRPNSFKSQTCPNCGAYLKYIEADAKTVAIKMYNAGLSISYAVAETYSFANEAIHVANINIGIAQNYPSIVFRELPTGYEYKCPLNYTPEYLSKIPLAQAISPVRTYATLGYEAEYLDSTQAKAMLRQKLKELDTWIDAATADSWFTLCSFAGFWL